MLKERPQACPADERNCVDSATEQQRIDSAHGTFSFARLYRLANREFAGLLRVTKRTDAKLLAVFAAGSVALSPAVAANDVTKKRPAAVSLSFDPISSFTPANADP